MTTLVLQKLETSLDQVVRFSEGRRYNIASIMPYLLMVNAPTGTFTFSIVKGSRTIVSKTFNSNLIKTSLDTSNNFAHVFYPIVFSNPLFLEEGDYIFRLSTDTTPTELSYMGWIQAYENKQNESIIPPDSDLRNSFSFRIKFFNRTGSND
jgi:hypothetical protein